MAELVFDLTPSSAYQDRKAMFLSASSEAFEQESRVKFSRTTTVYVGNLSFYTTEEQIIALFSTCGRVAEVIIGLNRNTKRPCGFCFVEFEDQDSAEAAVTDLDGRRLDDHYIKVSWDVGGLRDGDIAAGPAGSCHRQWGRGYFGDQSRDATRADFDKSRGGLGHRAALEVGVDQVLADGALRSYPWLVPPERRAAHIAALHAAKARQKQQLDGAKGGGKRSRDEDALERH